MSIYLNGNEISKFNLGTISSEFNIIDNIEELKSSNLKIGDEVITLGYYSKDDFGGTRYLISNSKLYPYIELNNGLFANQILDNLKINVKTIGIRSY